MSFRWNPDMGDWWIGTGHLVTPAWVPRNLELLWSRRPWDRSNISLPGVDGTLAVRPNGTEATHAITFHVSGLVDADGDPHPSIGYGFDANYEALADIVGDPVSWGDDYVMTEVTKPTGVTLGGPIQPSISPLVEESGAIARVVVTVTVPLGQLAEAGS